MPGRKKSRVQIVISSPNLTPRQPQPPLLFLNSPRAEPHLISLCIFSFFFWCFLISSSKNLRGLGYSPRQLIWLEQKLL